MKHQIPHEAFQITPTWSLLNSNLKLNMIIQWKAKNMAPSVKLELGLQVGSKHGVAIHPDADGSLER
jgi:hypothetical protein